MTATAPSATRQSAAPRSRIGWVGIDVGTSALTCAQVERQRRGWVLSGSLVVPTQGDRTAGLPAAACSFLAESPAFQGRRAACALPLSATELRILELPRGTDDEVREMISQELALNGRFSTSPSEFDFWELGEPQPSEGTRSYCVLSVARELAQRSAASLLKAGLKCEAVDGVPFALARAIELIRAPDQDAFVAVVDWGYTSVTLAIVADGRPVFMRSLRDCELGLIVERLGAELGLTTAECRPLLVKYGLPHPQAEQSASGLQHLVRKLAAEPLACLADEISRTLSFSGRQLRRRPPQSLVLFGGGAAIANVAEHLSSRLQRTVTAWRLPSRSEPAESAGRADSALLGVAAGLSLMGCRP